MWSRIKNRLRVFGGYLAHQSSMPAGPPEVGIDSTNRCTLDCIMCPRQKMQRPLGDMDVELFKKIIDEGGQFLEFVWLQDYGEPLLHKDISQMIGYCRKKKIPSGISTNALLLSLEVGEEILGAGLDYILFAFDGATRETYEHIRRGSNYEKVVENIRNFLKLKQRINSDIFVAVQCIYMHQTEEEIGAFRKMWRLPGVNALRLRQLTYSAERYGLKNKFNNFAVALPCYWLWRNPHIKWDGIMVPCCQDVNAVYNLGDLKTSSLVDSWNSQLMQDLRQAHLKGRRQELSLCRDCNMYQPVFPLAVGSFIFDAGFVNRRVPAFETVLSCLKYSRNKKQNKRV